MASLARTVWKPWAPNCDTPPLTAAAARVVVNYYQFQIKKKKNRVENLDKSQNVVEQANSNSNNTSFVVSRRHIICSSSILTTMKYFVTFLISYEET